MKLIRTERGNRKLDGSWGDIAVLQCACGTIQRRDIYECAQCGDAIAADTLDGEILCPECAQLHTVALGDIAVHCPAPHDTDCGEE